VITRTRGKKADGVVLAQQCRCKLDETRLKDTELQDAEDVEISDDETSLLSVQKPRKRY
jgi:hypothetical protein